MIEINRTGRLAAEDAHSWKNTGCVRHDRGVSQLAKEQPIEMNWYILCRSVKIAS